MPRGEGRLRAPICAARAEKPTVIDFHAHFMTDFSTYLRSFRCDTMLFNPDVLEQLATKVDASHIMLGSDFPFGEVKPVEFVQSAAKIPEPARQAILGANAARFLGVDI
jgi:predicted TIM-barrel fold metal-dependent hydrolase